MAILDSISLRYGLIAAVAAMLGLFVLLSTGGLGAQSDEGDACVHWLAGSTDGEDAIVGEWDADCLSETAAPGKAGERRARFYAFTLEKDATVTVALTSEADTYLYLLVGAGREGEVEAENDDIDKTARNYNSRLEAALSAGTYTIEATTYDGGVDGEFTLEVSFDPEDAVVVPTVTPLPDDEGDVCIRWLAGSAEGEGAIVGEWDPDCLSERAAPGKAGERRARFYAFTLEEEATVTVALTSEADTYLYLLVGAGREGEVEAENDDIDRDARNYNSRLEATLSAGTYTIEATTYDGGVDGEFTLDVSFDPEGAVSVPLPSATPTPLSATATAATVPSALITATTTPEPTPTPTPTTAPKPTLTPTLTPTPTPTPTPTQEPDTITASDVDGYHSEYSVVIFVSSIGTNLTMRRTNTYTSNRNYVKLRSDGTLTTGIGGTFLRDNYYWSCNPVNGSTGESRSYATDTYSVSLPKTDLSNTPLVGSASGRRVLRICNGSESAPSSTVSTGWGEFNSFTGSLPSATPTPLSATATATVPSALITATTTPEPTPTPTPTTAPKPTLTPTLTPTPTPTPTQEPDTITASDVDGYHSEYSVVIFVSSIGTNLTMRRTNTYTSNRNYVKIRSDGTLTTGIGGTVLRDNYYWSCNPVNGSTGESRSYATDTYSVSLPKTDLSNTPLVGSASGRRVLRICNGSESAPSSTVSTGWGEFNSFICDSDDRAAS